jgi:3-oxoacyl-[acyl-carrier protein] reductase
MFDLGGKVAVVTGGSRGIGRAICEALAAQGAHVVVGYLQGEQEAQSVAKTIGERGGSAEVAGFDVSDMNAAQQAVAAVAQRHGRLDILVANAGIAIDGLLLDMKQEDLDRQFAVNVKGAIACVKGALMTMIRARSGRIVLVSSVVGEMGNSGQAAYAATKAALLGVTKALAREYGRRAVTVNAVTPGLIETDMTHGMSEALRQQVKGAIPLSRMGKPDEVAAAVVYLCSDEASYVTGQTLRVNGGMYV